MSKAVRKCGMVFFCCKIRHMLLAERWQPCEAEDWRDGMVRCVMCLLRSYLVLRLREESRALCVAQDNYIPGMWHSVQYLHVYIMIFLIYFLSVCTYCYYLMGRCTSMDETSEVQWNLESRI